MKFGKSLLDEASSMQTTWKNHLVPYKPLKKVIKKEDTQFEKSLNDFIMEETILCLNFQKIDYWLSYHVGKSNPKIKILCEGRPHLYKDHQAMSDNISTMFVSTSLVINQKVRSIT